MRIKFTDKLIDFFLPHSCVFCSRLDLLSRKIGICKNCIAEKNKKETIGNVCEICGTELSTEICEYCSSRNVFFEKLYHLEYREKFQREILTHLKFNKEKILSAYFTLNWRNRLGFLRNQNFDYYIPVPSSKKTLRKRPYHTCDKIFQILEEEFQLKKIQPFLKVSNELQSGKTFRDRFIHASRAFQIDPKKKDFINKNLLLVDDVFTTGATINELSKLLVQNGANSVKILVLLKGKKDFVT
jgi:ComF family protein